MCFCLMERNDDGLPDSDGDDHKRDAVWFLIASNVSALALDLAPTRFSCLSRVPPETNYRTVARLT